MSTTPSPFSPTTPNFHLHWDSTLLGLLKECPAKFHMMAIQGYVPRSQSLHLYFGGLYASGVERYAHSRAEGHSHDDAVVAMARWVLENSGTRNSDGAWEPWESHDPIKNRYTLVRSLVWNADDRAETGTFSTVILANNKPAVELSFGFPAFEVAGETVSLRGHLDELVEFQGNVWVKDDKTTKGALSSSYFQQFSPNNQMSLYAIAGRVILENPISGVLVRAAQIGVGFTRFATHQAPRPSAVLEEWLVDAKWWITQAHNFAATNYWPHNDKSCGNYGGCPFQRVCSVSPQHRPAWLAQDFEQRPAWNPLVVRGDV